MVRLTERLTKRNSRKIYLFKCWERRNKKEWKKRRGRGVLHISKDSLLDCNILIVSLL
jgi:hypothetical protein